MLALSALVPACASALHLGNVADAGHDRAVARVLGLEPQAWHALDVALGALPSILPVGTRAARAALGSALAAGAAGAVLYSLARRLLAACGATRRLGPVVAAVAAATPLLGFPWQLESAVAGGSALGALLVLAPVACLVRAMGETIEHTEHPAWVGVAAGLGAAFGYEPLAGLAAVAGCAALLVAHRAGREVVARALGRYRGAMLLGAGVGLAPFVLALVRVRAAGQPLLHALAEGWAGERGAGVAPSIGGLVRIELGVVVPALAIAGAVLGFLVEAARPLVCALLALLAAGVACAAIGAPAGPARFAAPVLASLAAVGPLAGIAMQALVRAIDRARVPLARESAAMVLLLELVVPVEAADEALFRTTPRVTDAAAVWDDLAWGTLPPHTALLVTQPRVYARALAARAGGTLQPDVTVVPLDAHGTAAARMLARDPDLIPLWRDLELLGAPTEGTLSALASSRPVAMAYEPRWGRAVARSLVPAGLLDRLEPEPRGSSDRRAALDAFAAPRARLAAACGTDPDLAATAGVLLRARAAGIEATGDRDLAARALDEAKSVESRSIVKGAGPAGAGVPSKGAQP
jgi:hypothetical protein